MAEASCCSMCTLFIPEVHTCPVNFFNHVFKQHRYSKNFYIACKYPGCNAHHHVYESFRRHWKKEHSVRVVQHQDAARNVFVPAGMLVTIEEPSTSQDTLSNTADGDGLEPPARSLVKMSKNIPSEEVILSLPNEVKEDFEIYPILATPIQKNVLTLHSRGDRGYLAHFFVRFVSSLYFSSK